MLGPQDLVLCAGTIPRASFAERVTAAAEAGFSGISLFLSDYRAARASGLSDADMRARLADHGLEIAELDPLMSWLPGAELGSEANEQGAAFFQHTFGCDSFRDVATGCHETLFARRECECAKVAFESAIPAVAMS